MDPMKHRIWEELENYFSVELQREEIVTITDEMKRYISQNPNLEPDDMTRLTVQVVGEVLKRRG